MFQLVECIMKLYVFINEKCVCYAELFLHKRYFVAYDPFVSGFHRRFMVGTRPVSFSVGEVLMKLQRY